MDVNEMLLCMKLDICKLQEELDGIISSGTGWNLLGNQATVNNFLGTTNAIDFVLKTNNIERLRVTSGGLIGIGTNSPSAALDIAGQLRIRGGSPGVNKVLTSDANGLATWQAITIPSVTADNGLEVSNGTIVLGQNVSEANDPAKLLSDREIPMNGYGIYFKGSGMTVQVSSTGAISSTNSHSDPLGFGGNVAGVLTGLRVTNSSTNVLGGASVTLQNSMLDGGQLYMGGTGNSTVPRTLMVRNNSGTGGILISADAGDILFSQTSSILASSASLQYGRFVFATKNFILGTNTDGDSKLYIVNSVLGANSSSSFYANTTWNTTGTPTGLKLNITDTASNAASLLMDIQLSGASKFKIGKTLVDIANQIAIRGGSPAAGRVLTSDVNGVASWQDPSGTLTTANKGLSVNGSAVQLGQTLNAAGNPALISENREIPMATGTGAIVFTMPGQPQVSQTFTGFSHSLQGTSTVPPLLQMLISDKAKLLTLQWNDTASGFAFNAADRIIFGNNVGIGTGNTVTSALLQLGGGNGSPGTGAIKFTPTTLLVTPENYVLEVGTDGHLYYTQSTGTRVMLDNATVAGIDSVLAVGQGLQAARRININGQSFAIGRGNVSGQTETFYVDSGATIIGDANGDINGMSVQVYHSLPHPPGVRQIIMGDTGGVGNGFTFIIDDDAGTLQIYGGSEVKPVFQASVLTNRVAVNNNNPEYSFDVTGRIATRGGGPEGSGGFIWIDNTTNVKTWSQFSDNSDLHWYYDDGSTDTEQFNFTNTGDFNMIKYGAGTKGGTAAYYLGVTSAGKVIETPIPSGGTPGIDTVLGVGQALTANRNISAAGFSIGIGTLASKASTITIASTSGINSYGIRTEGVTVSSDADLVIDNSSSIIELYANLTADRTITLPAASINGKILTIICRGNAGSFHYNFSAAVTDITTGTGVTQLDWGHTYDLYVNSSLSWMIIRKY
jgi:hypothetical protein